MISFPRLYRPACGVTIAGQAITALGLPGVVSPRVAFRVRRTMTPTPDTADVSVYGLSPERRLAIQSLWSELGRAKVLIASGYEGITAQLFAGDARSLRASVRAGADFATICTADDAGDALADTTITLSTAGLTVQNMIDLALAALARGTGPVAGGTPGEVVVAHPSVAATIATATPGSTTLFYSAVSIGKATDLLHEAARILGCRWWIRDSQLFMARRGVPTDGLAILLPRSHWLDEPTEDGKGLVRVSTLLDPNIVPGRQLQLVGRLALADVETFRVETCEYSGDTDSGAPFRVDCEARRLLG